MIFSKKYTKMRQHIHRKIFIQIHQSRSKIEDQLLPYQFYEQGKSVRHYRLELIKLKHMLQFKTTEKKMFRPPGDSRRELKAWDNYEILDNSMVSRQPERNDNINSQLIANHNQIKELLKDRKYLLKSKYEMLLAKNKEKINSIASAKQADLKTQAKMLNDRSIVDLVDQAENLNKSKSLLMRVSEIRDMNGFSAHQQNIGKQFWDRHKQYEREKKKKAIAFQNNNKTIKQLQQRQRSIFYEIQRFEIQMVNLLTRNRNESDHIKRAQRVNQEIEKRKNSLRQIKLQKNKTKSALQGVIDDILQFNKANENIFEKRLNQLNDIFAGSQNMGEFQNLMSSLQKMIMNKAQQNRVESAPAGAQNFTQIFRNYDIVFEQIQKIKEDEDHVFNYLNQEFKQNIKNAIMEKIFTAGVSLKQDHNELLKKCRDYRKLLFQLNQERPRLKQEIMKASTMNINLLPIKKALNTEEIRRQQLKKQLKKLCAMNVQLQVKERQQRNFNFDMEDLLNKRKATEVQINDSAEKVNLVQYKNKMRELQQINKKISQKNDAFLNQQVQTLRREIQDKLNRIYDQYDDLVNEVQIQQQPNLGVFITKLQKRLSLI